MSKIAIFVTSLLAALSAGALRAEVNDEFAGLSQSIELARTLIATERKLLVMQEMQLTADEAEKFWPLYDEYEADLKKVRNANVKLITDYAAIYPNVTDKQARAMLEDWFRLQENLLRTKKKYVRRFARFLPYAKVARFYQLENKMDVVLQFKLASSIPLIGPIGAGDSREQQ